MFENLRKRIREEAESKKAESRFYIEHGYCENWSDDNKKPGDEGIRRYCTDTRWNAYQGGQLSREKIVQYTITRMEKQRDKYTIKKLDKLLKASEAPDIIDVAITVDWKHNSYWGWNPTATATIHTAAGREQYTGSASGCGYDKESAAIGEALNKSAAVLKMLYSAKEKALETMSAEQIAATQKGYVCESNRDFIAYGAGYGVLPYFEGGVGFASFESVFNACGFVLNQRNSSKHSDYYYFEKRGIAK